MSVADVASRIQQIQGQLALLSPRTSTSAVTGASFADALAGADATSLSAPGAAGTTSVPGQAVVDEAMKYVGVPYVWGGTDPSTGLDCSGLVQHVYEKLGIDLPRVSYQQARVGSAVPSLDQARPGDILAFGSPVHHVGIYIGDHKMVEAPRPGKNVQVSSVYETPTHIRRVLPETAAGAAPQLAGGAAGGVGSATPFAPLFQSAAQRYGVPATLLAAVAHQESGFDPTATSAAGARGLMQLMPATAQGLGVDPMNPTQAVDGAARRCKRPEPVRSSRRNARGSMPAAGPRRRRPGQGRAGRHRDRRRWRA